MSKIKLIVEIDEEDYGDFCDWFESVPSSVDGLPCVKGKFNTALYDAKPVDTSGDLIRREDLKKTIKDNGYSHYFEIFEIIDNAPTVPPDMAQVLAYESGYHQAKEDVAKRIHIW